MKKLLVVLVLGLLTACGAAALIDPKDVQKDATQISVCEQIGRDCKADGGRECFAKYESCLVDSGMK